MNTINTTKHTSKPGRRLAAGLPGASLLAAIVCASAILVSGCITSRETVRKEPERLKVDFENEEASRVFHEVLNRMPYAHGRHESETKVHIPVVLSVSRKVVVSENVAFNKAVRRCDANRDGMITVHEAHVFAERQEQ